MKVTEMTFSKSFKLKAPNFGNQGDIHYSVTVQIEEGDSIDEVTKAGWADVDNNITIQANEMMKWLGIGNSE